MEIREVEVGKVRGREVVIVTGKEWEVWKVSGNEGSESEAKVSRQN